MREVESVGKLFCFSLNGASPGGNVAYGVICVLVYVLNSLFTQSKGV